MINPDTKKDKFVSRTEVGILIDGLPSLSFIDGKVYNQSLLHYNADLYQTNSGKKYYLFREFKDCTLFIMNCNREVYKELCKQIELDDSTPIFETLTENNEETYELIPFDYRKKSGFGGATSIIFG